MLQFGSIMRAKIAFYKVPNNPSAQWDDKLIAWWTGSNYSHCELIVDGYWYSSSPRDGKVRKRWINPKDEHWEYVDIEIDEVWFYNFFKDNEGKDYDWKNIFFTQIIPLGLQNPNKWICSEFVGTAIFKEEFKGSPQKLYKRIGK